MDHDNNLPAKAFKKQVEAVLNRLSREELAAVLRPNPRPARRDGRVRPVGAGRPPLLPPSHPLPARTGQGHGDEASEKLLIGCYAALRAVGLSAYTGAAPR